jgi:hypothetical protein
MRKTNINKFSAELNASIVLKNGVLHSTAAKTLPNH